jgi:hypothetical protein
MAPEPCPEAMSANSLVHHIIVDPHENTVFFPNQLDASIGDTILFTPVKVGDSIAQVSSGQPCQADGSLSPLNFSRLIFPYLVTTEDPVWFYRPAPQQDCAPRDNDTEMFSLNPSDHHAVNPSITTSVAQTDFTSVPQASSLFRTGDGPAASVLTAAPSIRIRPVNHSTSAINNSIWATGGPSPGARPSAFLGRAAAKEVSRSTVSLLIIYFHVVGLL